MGKELRPYQLEAIDYAATYLKDNQRLLIQVPTGGGKTVIFAELVRRIAARKKTVCVLANRLKLVDQAADTFREMGIQYTLFNADVPSYLNRLSPYCIASVSTLRARSIIPQHDFIFVDEAHLKDFDPILAKVKNKVIGFTATPARMAGLDTMQDVYQHLWQGPQVNELVNDGYLVRADIYSTPLDYTGLRKTNGEFTAASQEKVLMAKANMESVFANWVKYKGKASIIFTPSVKASKEVADYFNERGYRIMHVDGQMDKAFTRKIDHLLKTEQIDGISNCALLTFGYDNPIIDTVVVDRSTMSLPLWLQMTGRGSRLYPGKTHFRVLDFGDNVSRHGHWQADRDWLGYFKGNDQTQSEDSEDPITLIRTCEVCYFVFDRKELTCPECGHVHVIKEKEVTFVEKDLQLVDFINELHSAIDWKSKTIQELSDYAIQKEYKLGWLVRKIKATYPDPYDRLSELAIIRGYSPAWVHRMIKVYF